MTKINSFLSMVKNESITNRIIILILLSYPALLMTVKGSMGVLYFLLFLTALTCLYRMRGSLATSHWDKLSIAFALAMTSPVVAIFLSQAYHGNFQSAPYDWASRFLLSVPIFLALRQTNINAITVMQWGILLGILAGLIKLQFDPFVWVDFISRSTPYQAFNLIHFSASILTLGFLSLFSINWVQKDPISVLALKYLAFFAAIYMTLQAGERGSWIAIPPLLLLWAIAHSKGKLWVKIATTTVVIVSIIWASYLMSAVVHERLHSALNELTGQGVVNKDSSIGIRLQLWHAALHLFVEQPFFGVGPDGFAEATPALTASGMLTPYAAVLGRAEVHNEILVKCAETGLFGLFAILALYLVPLFIFWRATHSTPSTAKIAGFMGVSLVLGFFIFGLSAEIFNLKTTASFFSLTQAILMAAATNRFAAQPDISSGTIPNR